MEYKFESKKKDGLEHKVLVPVEELELETKEEEENEDRDPTTREGREHEGQSGNKSDRTLRDLERPRLHDERGPSAH